MLKNILNNKRVIKDYDNMVNIYGVNCCIVLTKIKIKGKKDYNFITAF